jgi:hypothetical protein
MKDAISSLAITMVPNLEYGEKQIADLAIDMQVQLEKGTGTRPVLWLLVRARRRAADAIFTLTTIDPTQTAAIITLQSQIQLYAELMEDCREMLTRGREADRKIDEEDRIEIADVLSIDEARELGLQQTPEDI